MYIYTYIHICRSLMYYVAPRTTSLTCACTCSLALSPVGSCWLSHFLVLAYHTDIYICICIYILIYIYIYIYTHTYVCNCTYIWLSLAVCFWRESALQYAEVHSRELHSVAVCRSVYFAVYFRRESVSERHTHFESRYILTLTSSYVSPDHSPTLLSLSRSSSITGPNSACCARILAV